MHHRQLKNICFDTKLDKKLKGWYKGDSLRFSQIIMNLLSNALKYTLEGGKIGTGASTAHES